MMKFKDRENFGEFKYLMFEVTMNDKTGELEESEQYEMQVKISEQLTNGWQLCETYREREKGKIVFHYVLGV